VVQPDPRDTALFNRKAAARTSLSIFPRFERAGLSTLNEGQTVQYEIVSNRGKESAENLKIA
jgi:hypothetical protein